ncbi:TM2 domain-containing protein [Corynebacterium sp. sy039]|uniref:TM2 domain-containing protein n=1 Tax=Corynebacterium sp. sy039 TaxID=2599641 RepID=UPI001FEFABD1|nr:TM2 domain-containing protein [Corynebacterium sp. sy039]
MSNPFIDPVQQNQNQHNFNSVPQPYQSYPPQIMQQAHFAQAPMQSNKSVLIAAVLAFFLGGLGLHNFYLGYTKQGLTMLILLLIGSVLTPILIGVPIVVAVEIWAFVEFIMILTRSGRFQTDAHGFLL